LSSRKDKSTGVHKIVEFTLYSTSSSEAKKAIEILEEHKVPSTPRRSIHILSHSDGYGLTLEEGPKVGIHLNQLNYEESVAEQVSKIINDFKSEDPYGRLVIITGPPGTGKTYLIRSLIGELFSHRFIFIPAAIVDKLATPEFMKCLLSSSLAFKGDPICLVIEDADNHLAPREDKDTVGLSTILNLSDGIIGSALNLRVIATTNMVMEDIDKALCRPGRLSCLLNIEKLSPGRANQLLKSLLPAESTFPLYTEPRILADVYNDIRKYRYGD
jgi:hypothetical protein